jgi:hypothetical protein
MALTKKVKQDISRQLTVQTASSRILFTLRIDVDAINFMFTSRDIYNLKAKLKREVLGPLTLIQALIQAFDEGEWVFELQKNDINQITHLFFAKNSSQILLKANHEVMVMDCIYKINRYKMLLLIISGQIALHTNFYVAFCFMTRERLSDYIWAMKKLHALYDRLNLNHSVVFVIDMKRGLMLATREIFSIVNHLLCIWHINNNVLVNCKKSFDTKEAWDIFFIDWKKMIYSSSDRDYRDAWSEFSETYCRLQKAVRDPFFRASDLNF